MKMGRRNPDRWGNPFRWGKKITLLYMQSNNSAIPGHTFLMVAKHVNKKNAGKPCFFALLHSLAALTASFSAVAFYCFL